MNDARRDLPADDTLARLKRASLRDHAIRGAWQLSALLRRIEREAPHVQQRLRSAVEALQVLSAQLALEQEVAADDPSRPARSGEFF